MVGSVAGAGVFEVDVFYSARFLAMQPMTGRIDRLHGGLPLQLGKKA
jgi:hypothetical protein